MTRYNVERVLANGETKLEPISIAETPSEIWLREWVEGLIVRESFPDWIKAAEAQTEAERKESPIFWTPEKWMEYYATAASFVAEFCRPRVDLQSLAYSLPINDPNLDEASGFDTIYKNILLSVYNYQPSERRFFIHKGESYVIPDAGDPNRPGTAAPFISIGEAIEALQAEHVFNAKKQDKAGRDLDEYVLPDRKYHSILHIMAAVCRKKLPSGKLEKFPIRESDRRSFMEERVKLFGDITMDVGLDVAFFLNNSKFRFASTRTYNLLLRLRKR